MFGRHQCPARNQIVSDNACECRWMFGRCSLCPSKAKKNVVDVLMTQVRGLVVAVSILQRFVKTGRGFVNAVSILQKIPT